MKNISLFLHRVLYIGNYENEAHFLEMQKSACINYKYKE